jgi:anti-anti-sigma factor
MFQANKQGAVDIVQCDAPLNKDHLDDFHVATRPCTVHGQPMIVLDLADTNLVDSAGLESLLDLQEQVEHLGGTIKLAAAPALIADVLRITGVGDRFETFTTVKAAVGSFSR